MCTQISHFRRASQSKNCLLQCVTRECVLHRVLQCAVCVAFQSRNFVLNTAQYQLATKLLLFLTFTPQHTATHCNALQRTATHCNALQRTAAHCNALQHTATQCDTLQRTATNCDTLQHTATHCNTLQHTATRCNTLQHTATYLNALQHAAARY